MNKFTIALLQMASHGTVQSANLSKSEEFCRKATAEGSDLALLPEMWNIGCTFYDGKSVDDIDTWKARAITRESPFVRHYKNLAKELGMAIALTYLEATNGNPRNSASLIDRRGDIILTYSKVHTCEFFAERTVAPGESFPVCKLETGRGEVKIGFMICYDREFPESARMLFVNTENEHIGVTRTVNPVAMNG